MGQQTIPVLKNKFADGKTPTGSDFGDIFDSYFHKSNRLPQSQILGLQDSLDTLSTGMIYKEPVQNLVNLETTYPNPVKGWAVQVVNEKNGDGNSLIYQWDGVQWNNTGMVGFPADTVKKAELNEVKAGMIQLESNKNQFAIIPQELLTVTWKNSSATFSVDGGKNYYVCYGLGKYIVRSSVEHNGSVDTNGEWGIFFNIETERFEIHSYVTFKDLDINNVLLIALFNNGDFVYSMTQIVFNNKTYKQNPYLQTLNKSNYGVLSNSSNVSVDKKGDAATVTIKSGMFYILYGDCRYSVVNYSSDINVSKNVSGVWWLTFNIRYSRFEIYDYTQKDIITDNILIIAEFIGDEFVNSLSKFDYNGKSIIISYEDRLEMGVAAYDNFSIDMSGFPNVKLLTKGRAIYILTGKRNILYSASMDNAEVVKDVGVGDWKLWWIVYEPTTNIYNLYTRDEHTAKLIPDNAITIATFRERTLIETLSNFTVDGYTTDSFALSVQNSKDIENLKNISQESSSTYNHKDLGINNFQKPDADINLILVYGQSLASGAQTCPPLSLSNYKGNLMLGAYEWVSNAANSMDALNDLYARCVTYTQEEAEATNKSDQALAESPGINFVNANKKLFDDYIMNVVDRKFLLVNAAVGGQSIELLSKGCPNTSAIYYAKMLVALNKAKQLAASIGKSIKCCGVIWMQGEWNGRAYANQGWINGTNATNNKDNYKALFLGGGTSDGVNHNGLINDITSDIKNIFGQTDSPLFIGSQTAINTNQTFDMPIDMALLEASHESKQFFLTGSSYMVPNRGTHLDPNGSRWMGEFFAKVYYHVMYRGKYWEALQPIYIKKNKNVLNIGFNVVNSPLKFNVKQLQAIGNYGFQVKDSGITKAISSVIISGNEIVITGGTDFTGDVEVAYASTGVEYGNLCDSDIWNSFEVYKELPSQLKPSREPLGEDGINLYGKPYPMNNFSVKFYYKINKGESFKSLW